MSARDALIVALPPGGAPAAPPVWWRVRDARIVQTGEGLDGLLAAAGDALVPERVLGIAPVADTVLHRAAFAGLTERQAEVAARVLAGGESLLPPERLHVGLGAADDAGMRDIAAVDAGTMAAWLALMAAHGIDPASIVPAALLVDASPDDDTLVRASLAGETFLRARGYALVDDPLLVGHVAPAARIVEAAPETVEAGMLAALDAPPVELRSGAFAQAPARWWDRDLLRRAAGLVAAILVVGLLVTVARIGRAHAEIARIDARAGARVAQALASPPPLDRAVAQLDARLAALGGGPSRLSPALAALVAQLEPNVAVTLDSVAWRGDGTLAATLGAAQNADINPVLIALQGQGYVLTAVPRAGTDGRALADISIRSGR